MNGSGCHRPASGVFGPGNVNGVTLTDPFPATRQPLADTNGAEVQDSGWFPLGFNCAEERYIDYGNGLKTGFFRNSPAASGQFGYAVSPIPAAHHTNAGIGIGSTVAELRTAHPAVVIADPDEKFGTYADLNDGATQRSFDLTGPDDDDLVVSLLNSAPVCAR